MAQNKNTLFFFFLILTISMAQEFIAGQFRLRFRHEVAFSMLI